MPAYLSISDKKTSIFVNIINNIIVSYMFNDFINLKYFLLFILIL